MVGITRFHVSTRIFIFFFVKTRDYNCAENYSIENKNAKCKISYHVRMDCKTTDYEIPDRIITRKRSLIAQLSLSTVLTH